MAKGNYNNHILLFALLGVFIGCSRVAEKGIPVVVNLQDAVPIMFSAAEGHLLAKDFGGSVDDVIATDSTIYIRSGNELYSAPLEHVGPVRRISRKGRGPEEYVQLWDYGIDAGRLYLYDIDGKQILYFSKDGEYLNSIKLSDQAADNPFQSLIPAPWKNGYVGKRVYGMPDVPELSLYDESFAFVAELGTDRLRSGIRLWRQFFYGSDNDILYCRYFSNEVLQVTKDRVSVKYSIDFMGHNVPYDEDEYALLEKLSGDFAMNRYAVIMGPINESKDYFCFQFASNAHRMIAVYEKVTRNCRIYQPEVKDQDVRILFCQEGKLYMITQDGNDSLWVYSKAILPPSV